MNNLYTVSHIGKGQKYQESFYSNDRRRIIWEIERKYLLKTIQTNFNNKSITHLDFACGTGRIIGYLSKFTKKSIGVDVSSSMLKEAEKNVKRNNVQLIKKNILLEDELVGQKFEIITAFRFFPNADDCLREQAMYLLSEKLSENGLLIFNNHRNMNCLRNIIVRCVTFGKRGNSGWAHEKVECLVKKSNLSIIKIEHVGIWPEFESITLMPRIIVDCVERFYSKIKLFPLFAENIIYTCGKNNY